MKKLSQVNKQIIDTKENLEKLRERRREIQILLRQEKGKTAAGTLNSTNLKSMIIASKTSILNDENAQKSQISMFKLLEDKIDSLGYLSQTSLSPIQVTRDWNNRDKERVREVESPSFMRRISGNTSGSTVNNAYNKYNNEVLNLDEIGQNKGGQLKGVLRVSDRGERDRTLIKKQERGVSDTNDEEGRVQKRGIVRFMSQKYDDKSSGGRVKSSSKRNRVGSMKEIVMEGEDEEAPQEKVERKHSLQKKYSVSMNLDENPEGKRHNWRNGVT